MPFSALGLTPSLAHAAQTCGLTTPTPVQTQAIPAILAGHDLRACAPTGSGKTAAYVLPLLQAWMLSAAALRQGPRATQTLILVPTRELAAQVAELFDQLGAALERSPKLVVLTGGVSINPQLMALRGGADILIATPGRLLDVAERSLLLLKTVKTLVMDEADRLMDLGFAVEIDQVLDMLPPSPRRQTLLLSATFAPDVQNLAAQLLRPGYAQVDLAPAAEEQAAIAQRALHINAAQRTSVLRMLAQQHSDERLLVFVASRYSAEHVASKLGAKDIHATALHGELSQGARQRVLQEFKAGHWQVLITTDLASRGIHIDGLPLVVNYDLPRSADDYTHRIGRTGRAGRTGMAISFVSPATEAHWKLIAKRNGLAEVELESLPDFPVTEKAPERAPHEDSHNGGVKGKRMSKKDKLRAAAAAANTPGTGKA